MTTTPTLIATSKAVTVSGTPATSLACNLPTGVANGDLLVAVVSILSANVANVTLNTPSGYTVINDVFPSANPIKIRTFRKIAASEGASQTFTFSLSSLAIVEYFCYRGVDATNPINASGFDNSGISNDAPSITTTVNNCALIGWEFAYAGSATTFTKPTAFTLDQQADTAGSGTTAAVHLAQAIAHFSQSTSGPTGITTWTPSGAPSATVPGIIAVAPFDPAIPAVANAAGKGAASANGRSIFTSKATATGIGTASAPSAKILASHGNANGMGTALSHGQAQFQAIANADGSSSASAHSQEVIPDAGLAMGVGGAAGAGQSIAGSAANADGISTAEGTGAYLVGGVAAANGVATASANSQAITGNAGLAMGLGRAQGVAQAVHQVLADASGSATAVGVGGGITSAAGQAAGVGEATADTALIIPGSAIANGEATAESVGGILVASTAQADGMATAFAMGGAIADAAAQADGICTAVAIGKANHQAEPASTVAETATGATPLHDALVAGIGDISYSDCVRFHRYVRLVLPIDGFVFWCRDSLFLTKTSAFNEDVYNIVAFNEGAGIDRSETDICAAGSLHFTSNKSQDESGNPTINGVIFTSEVQLEQFNRIGPSEMWVGEFHGKKFSFRESFKFYKQAGIFHYRGDALESWLDTQLIDAPIQVDTTHRVVSNSLPAWLTLNDLAPVYPSYLVPANLPPPYISVHIEPDSTRALQAIPLIDISGSHWQLMQEHVRCTLYGLRNDQALDYQDYILDAATPDDGPFGLMNMPSMRDEKLTKVEMQVIAQKKVLEFDISYYQTRIQDLSRQLIKHAMINVIISDRG